MPVSTAVSVEGGSRALRSHRRSSPSINRQFAAAVLACVAVKLVSVSSESLPAEIGVQPCKGKKITILSLDSFAASTKIPVCNLSNVVVNSRDGTVYLSSERERLQRFAASHEVGSHAAPWYLREAIKSSKYYTDKLEDADIVYVDDYCYYIWWLATVHTKGRSIKETPGDYLMSGYRAMMDLPKWRRAQGREFVFYDSHPGFAAGDAARPYQQLKCFEARKSVHLVMDTPMRYACGGGWPYNKLLITPYNPNRLDVSGPAARHQSSLPTLSERTLLVYHRAACAKLDAKVNNFNAGKMMRQHLAKLFVEEARDVQVKCTNFDYTTAAGGGKPMAFQQMFEHMQKTVFCLVLPGDAASTRRFSEIMMAGCIPTFVGPPYHSMPLIHDVDYRSAAIYFNISDYSPWLKASMQTHLDPRHKSAHETEGRWWIPDGEIGSEAIAIQSAAEIIQKLRTFPAAEASRKLKLMRDIRHYFSFDTELTAPPNAVNALLSGICHRAAAEPNNI